MISSILGYYLFFVLRPRCQISVPPSSTFHPQPPDTPFLISPNNQGYSSAHIPSQPADVCITTIRSTICGTFFFFFSISRLLKPKFVGVKREIHHRPPGRRISASTSALQGGLRCATNASLFPAWNLGDRHAIFVMLMYFVTGEQSALRLAMPAWTAFLLYPVPL